MTCVCCTQPVPEISENLHGQAHPQCYTFTSVSVWYCSVSYIVSGYCSSDAPIPELVLQAHIHKCKHNCERVKQNSCKLWNVERQYVEIPFALVVAIRTVSSDQCYTIMNKLL